VHLAVASTHAQQAEVGQVFLAHRDEAIALQDESDGDGDVAALFLGKEKGVDVQPLGLSMKKRAEDSISSTSSDSGSSAFNSRCSSSRSFSSGSCASIHSALATACASAVRVLGSSRMASFSVWNSRSMEHLCTFRRRGFRIAAKDEGVSRERSGVRRATRSIAGLGLHGADR